MNEIESPCIRTCCLDADDICLGCGRALDEITGWSAVTDQQKRVILDEAKIRLSKRTTDFGAEKRKQKKDLQR